MPAGRLTEFEEDLAEHEAGGGGVLVLGQCLQQGEGLGVVVGVAGQCGGLGQQGGVGGAGRGELPGGHVQGVVAAPGAVGRSW